MSEVKKTFYLTKWALASGVIRVENMRTVVSGGTEYASSIGHGGECGGRHLFESIGKDAFENESDAKARVKEMAKAKLASLEKQKKKLLKMLESE